MIVSAPANEPRLPIVSESVPAPRLIVSEVGKSNVVSSNVPDVDLICSEVGSVRRELENSVVVAGGKGHARRAANVRDRDRLEPCVGDLPSVDRHRARASVDGDGRSGSGARAVDDERVVASGSTVDDSRHRSDDLEDKRVVVVGRP